MENYPNTYILKHTILEKLSYAVGCSILSHLVLVLLYAISINISFEGGEWFKSIVDNVTSISTWLYIIPFITVIFAQIIICASVYMLHTNYQVTRFRKWISLISFRTLLLAFLHIVIGGGEIWMYLYISNGKYKDMYVKCNEQDSCLRNTSYFLILSGFWTGTYYFSYYHVADRKIIFPVIPQQKLPQLKAKLFPLIKQSYRASLTPTVLYIALYTVLVHYTQALPGNYLHRQIQHEPLSFRIYLSVWIFSTLYFINMNLMRFFFELFLTEPFNDIDNFSLSEALMSKNVPILQHLACLDLYLLSKWSPQRRQALFMLTQPGAHPHAWNSIFQPAIQILLEFMEVLNRATDSLLSKDDVKPLFNLAELRGLSRNLQSPLVQPPTGTRYDNMKNMSFLMQTPQEIDNLVQVNVEPRFLNFSEMFSYFIRNITTTFSNGIWVLQHLRIFKYFFGELPEVHIQQCLRNGQLVMWTSYGLANIAVASFREDPYGIVQKDLPGLIKIFFDLKQSIEKLNKLSMFSSKSDGFDYFSFKMKNNVNTGVRLSLGNISRTFGKYMNDIALSKDVVVQLQTYI